jgi:DNA-binding PadR family transcriptional regulator
VPNRDKADILQGTLDLMLLQTVATLGPLYGYSISPRLTQVSGGSLQVNMGTLNPGLMRLEQRRLIRGSWGTTENNRRAASTPSPRQGGESSEWKKADWERTASIMRALLEPQQ